ncbi:hypothetical protein [Nakamurella sp.]|uniref:hypothetical protein n=1 Tax=Nakamurella sp. TaxID=1869182 RepID=UPI003B3A20A3
MFDVLSLLLALGGGFFAAAIGALHSFIFTGFMVIAGTGIIVAGGSADFLNTVAFGPVFGPHVAFAGGVAAAAYAARRTKDVGGKDIGVPLISVEKPDVLIVGALFGAGGYLLQLGVAKIPWFGTHTDTVAFTVFISALVVRLFIGRASIFGNLPEGAGWGRFAPKDETAWVRYHEKFVPNTVLGLGAGLFAAGTSLKLHELFPDAAPTQFLVFGLSAASLLFLSLGLSFPVTHHITIIAGVGAVTFLPIVNDNYVLALIIGTLFGMMSAWFAEAGARLFHDHGNTHIDPPATAIWPATLVVLTLAGLFA